MYNLNLLFYATTIKKNVHIVQFQAPKMLRAMAATYVPLNPVLYVCKIYLYTYIIYPFKR